MGGGFVLAWLFGLVGLVALVRLERGGLGSRGGLVEVCLERSWCWVSFGLRWGIWFLVFWFLHVQALTAGIAAR